MRDLSDTFLRPEDFDDGEELQTDPPEPYLLKRVVQTVGIAGFVAFVAAGVWTR